MTYVTRNAAVDHRCLSFCENGSNLGISRLNHELLCIVASEIENHSGSEDAFLRVVLLIRTWRLRGGHLMGSSERTAEQCYLDCYL